MLQRALTFDEQDVALGMDTYYVEWCGQGWSGYGGIAAVRLSAHSLHLQFDPLGTAMLGGLECVTITLESQQHALVNVRDALQRLFVGTSCRLDWDI